MKKENFNPVIEVVAAILSDKDRFLLVQRPFIRGNPLSGLWEFPGGKLEFGETMADALFRELKEELDIEAWGFHFFMTSISIQQGTQINLHCFFVDGFEGLIHLNEHRSALWQYPRNMRLFPLAPGDVDPVRRLTVNHLR